MKITSFKAAANLWSIYSSTALSNVDPSDCKHQLRAEVNARLNQLDICLGLVQADILAIAPEPGYFENVTNYIREFGPKLDSGEMSRNEYINGFPHDSNDHGQFSSYVPKIRLFTETFYFVAWRIREIFNSNSPAAKWPHLQRLQATAIRNVRNQLIEHPENQKKPNFSQDMMITDAGPALKTGAVVWWVDRTSATRDSLDQGLYVNAVEFEREIVIKLLKSISALTDMQYPDQAVQPSATN